MRTPRAPLAALLALLAAAACTRLLGGDYTVDPSLAAGSSTGGRGGQGGGASGGAGGAPPTVVEIKAGGRMSCARLSDGSVRCWGVGGPALGTRRSNNLGDDEPPGSAGPVDLGGEATQLAVAYHACALLEGGAVRCWGLNDFAELGYGNTNPIGDNEAPASAGPIDLGGKATQIAAGSLHTCALLEDGSARCWGFNGSGELGYGNVDPIGDDETPASAGPIDLDGRATQIAAGVSHTCALLEGGAVRCWGSNQLGQLGLGNADLVGDDELPAAAELVDVGGKATQIAAGNYHTCALLEGGAVRCWGDNTVGQLGQGNTDLVGDDERPSETEPVALGGKATQIAAGGASSCARLEDASLRCWGANDAGQLGYGRTDDVGDDERPVDAGPLDVGGPVSSCSLGEEHACALLESGAVRCWGQNLDGQLGLGAAGNVGDDEPPAQAPPVQLF
ncbi:MAG TPA: hypothetical protein VFS43_12730 [Polyangiaceae bacterium]|nr:hypothetical protein [Polyangiaceae bacterium]